MKTLRRLFAVIVLTFALALSSSAGIIHTTVVPPESDPQPSPAEGGTSATTNGDMHTGNSDETTVGDAVVAGALSLVQSVLALL